MADRRTAPRGDALSLDDRDTLDKASSLPPTYEESVANPIPLTAATSRNEGGKPERPAPPYCLVEQTSRPCPPTDAAYSQAFHRPDRYEQDRGIPLVHPHPASVHPHPASVHPHPASVQPQTVLVQPQHASNNERYVITSHCAAIEGFLAQKSAMRICLVGVIMSIILLMICILLETIFLVTFIISGIVFSVMLAWSITLKRKRRIFLMETERRQNLNRVQLPGRTPDSNV